MTAFAANFVSETGMVWINTCVATCAAILGWLLLEKLRDGKPTSVGAASGAVAGLVAITPACGSLSPVGSIVLGVVVGIACAWAVGLKYKFGFDDSLDVVGVHLVGGTSARWGSDSWRSTAASSLETASSSWSCRRRSRCSRSSGRAA